VASSACFASLRCLSALPLWAAFCLLERGGRGR